MHRCYEKKKATSTQHKLQTSNQHQRDPQPLNKPFHPFTQILYFHFYVSGKICQYLSSIFLKLSILEATVLPEGTPRLVIMWHRWSLIQLSKLPDHVCFHALPNVAKAANFNSDVKRTGPRISARNAGGGFNRSWASNKRSLLLPWELLLTDTVHCVDTWILVQDKEEGKELIQKNYPVS